MVVFLDFSLRIKDAIRVDVYKILEDMIRENIPILNVIIDIVLINFE